MGRTLIFTPKEVITAIHRTKGLMTHTARVLGCSPHTVENYAKRYPAVRQAITDERKAFVDTAELSLMKAVQDGQPWAVALVLKTLGRHRGYSEENNALGGDPGAFVPIREVVVEMPALPDFRAEKSTGDLATFPQQPFVPVDVGVEDEDARDDLDRMSRAERGPDTIDVEYTTSEVIATPAATGEEEDTEDTYTTFSRTPITAATA